MQCSQIIEGLEQLSPKQYACEWDNVGLLVGRREKEVKRVMIALDATQSRRPDKKDIKEFFYEIKQAYPNQKWMADCSTVEEMIQADALGFDYIATTLVGYTPQSKGVNIADNDFSLLREILHRLKHPIIAEGNIDSPEKAKEVLQLGCYSVVVGSSITRPQVITKRFVDAIKEV